jgi:hypothetical protein
MLEVVQYLVLLPGVYNLSTNLVFMVPTTLTAHDRRTHSVLASGLVVAIGHVLSAAVSLVCIQIIDSWHIPRSWAELQRPVLRLTREMCSDCKAEPREYSKYSADIE